MTKQASYYTLPDGCSLHATCNSCPYPDCQASLKDLKKRSLIDDLHVKVLALHGQDVPVRVIQERTGYKDVRTIYRIIREEC